MKSFSTLHLLKPKDLSYISPQVSQNTEDKIRFTLARYSGSLLKNSNIDTLNLLRELDNEIGEISYKFTPYNQSEFKQAFSMQDKEYAVFDAFFMVQRVSGDPFNIFMKSFIQAYSQILQEYRQSENSLSNVEWKELWTALDSFFIFLNPPLSSSFSLEVNTKSSISPHDVCNQSSVSALHRWQVGHHIFFKITQSLIITFNLFQQTFKVGNINQASIVLELATKLMRGAVISFYFTADFPPDDYETIVRPAMATPKVEISLSGLMNEDHKYLNNLLPSLKVIFAKSDPKLRPYQEEFIKVFGQMYDAHKHVCATFGGNKCPSLRMSQKSKKNSVEILDKFYHNRRHSFMGTDD